MFLLCLLPSSYTAMVFIEKFFFGCLLIFLFPLWNYYIHSLLAVYLNFVWDLEKSSYKDFSIKYCIPSHFSTSLSHGNEHRKLKYLPVCDQIFSGIYLLSVIFIKQEMETHALGRSSQVRAKLLLPAFASWINFSRIHVFQEILRFQALMLFVQGYLSTYVQWQMLRTFETDLKSKFALPVL